MVVHDPGHLIPKHINLGVTQYLAAIEKTVGPKLCHLLGCEQNVIPFLKAWLPTGCGDGFPPIGVPSQGGP